jgi:hypothetical protein
MPSGAICGAFAGRPTGDPTVPVGDPAPAAQMKLVRLRAPRPPIGAGEGA